MTYLKNLYNHYFGEGRFGKSALDLARGSAISQILALLASPLITRLFSPLDFGLASLFFAAISFASIIITLRLDTAIVSAKSEVESAELLLLSLILLIPVGFISSGIYFLMIQYDISGYGHIAKSTVFLFFATLFATGVFTTLKYWLLKNQKFTQVARITISQSVVKSIAQILLGYFGFGAWGLIYGDLVGRLSSVIGEAKNAAHKLIALRSSITFISLTKTLMRNLDFVRYTSPSSLIEGALNLLPISFVAGLYGVEVAGHFGLTQRVLALPMTFIGTSIGDAFHVRFSQHHQTSSSSTALFFVKSLALMIGIGLLPAIIIWQFSENLFVFVFGEPWRLTGELAPILMFWYLASFVVGPLSRSVFVAGGQGTKLIFDTIRLCGLLLLFRHIQEQNMEIHSAAQNLSYYNALTYVVYLFVLFFVVLKNPRSNIKTAFENNSTPATSPTLNSNNEISKRKTLIHLMLSEYDHDSRVRKEVFTATNTFNVLVFALAKRGDQPSISHMDNATIYRIAARRTGGITLIRHALTYFDYLLSVLKHLKHFTVDVIHVNNLSPLSVGVLLKLLLNQNVIKLIYDCHELETERLDVKVGSIKHKVLLLWEKCLVRYVDSILTVSPSIARIYIELYNKPTHLVLNTPRLAHINKNHPSTQIDLRSRFSNYKDIIIHTGAAGKGRGLTNIIRTAALLPEAAFVFLGSSFKDSPIANTPPNVFFLPPAPPSEVVEITSQADVGLCLFENICRNHDFCLPNKLFEYLQARIPVVVTPLTELKQFVTLNKVGLALKNDNPETISEGIRLVLKNKAQFKVDLEKAAQKYCWEAQESALLSAYIGDENEQ